MSHWSVFTRMLAAGVIHSSQCVIITLLSVTPVTMASWTMGSWTGEVYWGKVLLQISAGKKLVKAIQTIQTQKEVKSSVHPSIHPSMCRNKSDCQAHDFHGGHQYRPRLGWHWFEETRPWLCIHPYIHWSILQPGARCRVTWRTHLSTHSIKNKLTQKETKKLVSCRMVSSFSSRSLLAQRGKCQLTVTLNQKKLKLAFKTPVI